MAMICQGVVHRDAGEGVQEGPSTPPAFSKGGQGGQKCPSLTVFILY